MDQEKTLDANVKESSSKRAVVKEKGLAKCFFNREGKHQRET